MLKSEKKDFKLKVNKYFDTLKNVDSMGQIRYMPLLFFGFFNRDWEKAKRKENSVDASAVDMANITGSLS